MIDRRGFLGALLALPIAWRSKSKWPPPSRLVTPDGTPGPWVMHESQVQDFEANRAFYEKLELESRVSTARLKAMARAMDDETRVAVARICARVR